MQGGKDREQGEERSTRQCEDTIGRVIDGRTEGQAVWRVHRGTDRQTNKQNLYCWVCRGRLPDCVCKRARRVWICLFALVCVCRLVSPAFWLRFLCALTHVCLYVPCRYHTAGAQLYKPKSDSLYSTLWDILPFIFPLWLKSKSLLSLAQLSPLEVSLAKNEAQCVLILCGDTLRYKNALHQLYVYTHTHISF